VEVGIGPVVAARPVPVTAPAAAGGAIGQRAPVTPPAARAIVLYRKNLARAVRTPGELEQQIQRTLWHEIGHLRGYDEDELRRLGLE
jgi:predicted Zn-dependent protease with MMP-like domain